MSIGLRGDADDDSKRPQQRVYGIISLTRQNERENELSELLFPCSHHYNALAQSSWSWHMQHLTGRRHDDESCRNTYVTAFIGIRPHVSIFQLCCSQRYHC